MIFLILRRRKVPVLDPISKGAGTLTPVRKAVSSMKILTMMKTMEKEVRAFKNQALQSIFISQEGVNLTGWIRIQMEETKRKIVFFSPAALRFVGPGDS
ncbi:hypothetical protein [Niallia endozanthoxylica]|uniref:Uncharacterized protein n=1 Tax=Niallia endozanthoxylica TaxID=2036016 RepID=A0A5J5HIF6_9BACI|nr:hypothetical protein [Niallia endozanthoxylica]KAA9019543.1 hypothetical protein F4V44_19560 [Niallia endozanthoxylica]